MDVPNVRVKVESSRVFSSSGSSSFVAITLNFVFKLRVRFHSVLIMINDANVYVNGL